MEIKEIINKQEWEDSILLCHRKSFLHSWNWGEFHLSLGNKIWRFGIYKPSAGSTSSPQASSEQKNELVAVALVVKISAKRGSFLLVPHGPVIGFKIYDLRFKILETLLNKIKELAKQEKADFIRISPILERTPENAQIFKELGFRQGPLHYHPESSWKLIIEPAEADLLTDMRKTTRYLIKQAEANKDIEIVRSTNPEDLKNFYDIHKEVVKVQKFVPFSLEYLKKEFEAFLPDNISLFFAKYKGKIIAGSFEIFWSGMAFYHHAALLPEYKKIPAAYLLQWEAIKEAKKRGCKIYDFWGYSDPVKYPKHPYSGPTLFKMGFGGYKDEYVKTEDFIISQKYWLNYIIETIRKIKRGL
ncbi:MAG: peptidoglycan bridge formation glycyltransferase FemA/FemB family protein [Patescibacteria group bacterium]